MKNIIITLIITLSFVSCKAQIPVASAIVPIDASPMTTADGAYYKDLNNEFDKFIGTWVFTNGNDEFTIVLDKKLMYYNGDYYTDMLYGEYKYTENGIEIVNTLPDLNLTNVAKHDIKGVLIIDINSYHLCDTCNPNERRVKLSFNDMAPDRKHLSASIILRYLNNSNPPQMTVTLISDGGGMLPTPTSPTVIRVPYGEYLMTKQ